MLDLDRLACDACCLPYLGDGAKSFPGTTRYRDMASVLSRVVSFCLVGLQKW